MSFNANGQKIDLPLSKEEERLRALIQHYPCDNSSTTTCLSVLKKKRKKKKTYLLDFLMRFACFEFEDAVVLFLPSVWLIMGHINTKIFEIVIIFGNIRTCAGVVVCALCYFLTVLSPLFNSAMFEHFCINIIGSKLHEKERQKERKNEKEKRKRKKDISYLFINGKQFEVFSTALWPSWSGHWGHLLGQLSEAGGWNLNLEHCLVAEPLWEACIKHSLPPLSTKWPPHILTWEMLPLKHYLSQDYKL